MTQTHLSTPEAPFTYHSPLSRRLAAALLFTAALLVASAAAAQVPPAPPRPVPHQQFGYVLGQPAAPPGYVPAAIEGAPRRDTPTAPKATPSSVAFDVAVATELPIMVGGQATLELPYRVLLQAEFGLLPPAYVNAVDGALVSAGAYDRNTSALVRSGLKDSLIVRASAGFRPFADHGFEIMGGYTLASFGGGLSARQAIESATGLTLPAEIPDAQIPMRSTIHNLHLSVGWRWVIADHFVIRASIAYMQSVGSSSRVEIPAGVPASIATAQQLAQINQVVNTTLNDTYTSYVKMPVVGLSMGYRF